MLQQVTLSELSLDSFDEWLTSASWNMHKDSSAEAVELVGQIELLLSEQEIGLISHADLIRSFNSIVDAGSGTPKRQRSFAAAS